MNEARELIAAFLDLNRTSDRKVGHFTSSLVGMFGTESMLNEFMSSLDSVLASGKVAEPLKTRAANLMHTFIPQVASFNKIEDLSYQQVTAAQLRAVRADTPQNRTQGVRIILTSFMKILDEVVRLD